MALAARGAKVVVGGCERPLNPLQIAALHEVIDRITDAQNPASYALAAVEGYRVLISAQAPDASPVQIDVSMLDYVGFRYQAGASSTPVLWNDMRGAAVIADRHWAAVAPRISDLSLKERFVGEVTALHAAILAQDVAAARRASIIKLDDVDRLEEYFSDRPQR